MYADFYTDLILPVIDTASAAFSAALYITCMLTFTLT